MRKVYIETYGCQMNLNDTEIVSSVIKDNGYEITEDQQLADVILLNTCSVRDNAERRIHERLIHLKHNRKKNPDLLVGVLGCMAERLQQKLIDDKEIVNMVVGPDEYRRIGDILDEAYQGEKGIAVKLSTAETYDDIKPLRKEGISAWLSIMRGCNNFCSYCVVPYTRGRERSRPFASIMQEISQLKNEGYKEITLLGQNVNSYYDEENSVSFPQLLQRAAETAPDVRFRFTTSHPKDISDELIETIASQKNICNHIHLAMQSGSDRILKLMNRKYTIGHYLDRIKKIREAIPNCSLTTDIIAGFPTETEEDHLATLEAVKQANYDGAFMFRYSPRENTKAFEMDDDVPEDVKLRRLNEIINLQQEIAKQRNKAEIGRIHEVIAEGPSKKNPDEWMGRSDTNKVVIFPYNSDINRGDIIKVKIKESGSATLRGELVT